MDIHQIDGGETFDFVLRALCQAQFLAYWHFIILTLPWNFQLYLLRLIQDKSNPIFVNTFYKRTGQQRPTVKAHYCLVKCFLFKGMFVVICVECPFNCWLGRVLVTGRSKSPRRRPLPCFASEKAATMALLCIFVQTKTMAHLCVRVSTN